ncbi:hypothetical protein LC612_39570 [Nostoc sp. CHAB 5834]|nr:hypothetical protein [Nostoc sp. CHAB 5834]
MGQYTRPGTEITDFTPDDTPTSFYLECWAQIPLSSILEKAKQKWGEHVRIEDLHLRSEHIQTHCLHYDRHDPGDYSDFLLVSYQP